MIHAVVLCGGSGTRLWPSSRQAFPKQFASLIGARSLFQATLQRFSGPEFDQPLVMTNADFRFLATEQCAAIGLSDARVVVEPAVRNTAPAVLAAALMLEDEPDALMLVAPSDHLIAEEEAFREAVRAGVTEAEAGNIVTFGVCPDSPETGYGYLELSSKPCMGQAVEIAGFIEKPDLQTAQKFVADGRYLWNAGIFLARVQDWLSAFEAHAPDMIAPCRASVAAGKNDLDFFRLGAEEFERVCSASIDYAIMERASNIVTVPMAVGWTDLGSWDALFRASDSNGDGLVTQGEATAINCENVFLRSEDENIQLVGVGLTNVAAVATRDAVLVIDMDSAQDVKKAVEKLKNDGKSQATDYPRFFRPWGWYRHSASALGFR